MQLTKTRKNGFESNFSLWDCAELESIGIYTAKEFKAEMDKTWNELNPGKAIDYDFGDGYDVNEIPNEGLFIVSAACLQKDNGVWVVFNRVK